MKRRYCFFNVDGLLNRSSDWKKPFTINYGLVIKIYAKTPYLKGRPREKEIERFLYFHKPLNYIVIDGNPDEYERTGSHIFFIDPETGFTETDAKRASKLLSKLDKKMAG